MRSRIDLKSCTLRDCALFSGLDARLIGMLADACTLVEQPEGRLLFARGDRATGLIIVVTGLVRVGLSDIDGNELTLALIGPGESVGEMALIDGGPRSADAATLEASRLLYLDARDFALMQMQEPAITRHLLVLLAARLRGSNEALMDTVFLPLRARLCRKLLDLADVHAAPDPPGAVFRRSFTQGDLARMLGVSREAINRQITALRHDGLIRLSERRLEIADLGRLRAMADMV